MIDIDSESFLFIVLAGAVAAFVAGLVSPRMPLPVVVLEVLLGILIGPDLLGLADSDEFIDFFSNLGLGMLFFFAGYEIDFERIRGSPAPAGRPRMAAVARPRVLPGRIAHADRASCCPSCSPARRWPPPPSER